MKIGPFELQLREDWGWVLRHAWSVRFIAVAGVLTGAETALPLVANFTPIPPPLYAGLMFILTCGALMSRLVVQRSIGNNNASQD